MGRKRKKEVQIFKRRLPEQYLCPSCGMNTIRVNLSKKNNTAMMSCGTCNLRKIVNIGEKISQVDAYCLFVDNYYNPG
jgi:transcription elongation factor Elf1